MSWSNGKVAVALKARFHCNVCKHTPDRQCIEHARTRIGAKDAWMGSTWSLPGAPAKLTPDTVPPSTHTAQ